jgi:hypothetical protein
LLGKKDIPATRTLANCLTDRPTGPKSKLANGKTVTNLASYNFYNFNANEQIKEKAIQTLRTYGVGPCGPPQFYGTQDVHMKTEADIASYLGTEGCIVYAHSFSTISSVIPSFCKRGDIIVADRGVNYSIRRGLEISRSSVKWYNHGDTEELEQVMRKVVKEQAGKKLTRRFIVTEALFETTGDINNLPKLVSAAPFLHGRKDKLTFPDRTQREIQIPPHARRNLVLRRTRPHRPRSHRSAKRGPFTSRYDRWLFGRAPVRGRRLLRRRQGCRGAPARVVDGLHLLCRAPRHARRHGQREHQPTAVEPRDTAAVPREYSPYACPA